MNLRNFEPQQKEMGHHIASGILNSGAVQVVKVLCQIGSVIVLSRLLPPSDFGLVAMVSPIYGFVALFQDLGLNQATVQKPALTHEEVNAFFWINAGAGAALSVLIVAVSPLVGRYYGDSRVVLLTAAMGLLLFVGSTGTQHSAILLRRMQFPALALTGTLGVIGGLAVSIIAALILKNYWALYLGMAASIWLPVIGVWLASRWRPSMPRLVPGLGHMLKFGGGITTANLVGFIASNADNILIGRRWGDHALGLYDRSYKLLLFPLERIAGPVANTMVPVLSRLTGETERYRSIFLKAMAQLTLAIWPGVLWAIVFCDILVPTLLGERWSDAAAIFRPLAIASLPQTVNCLASCLFISQGRVGEYARRSIFNACMFVSGYLIGLPYGPVGVAIAYCICEYIRTPLNWYLVGRKGPVGWREVARAVMPQIAGGCASLIALVGFRNLIIAPSIVMLPCALVISYAATAATMALLPEGRETLRQSAGAARRILLHMKFIRA
jgi:PST family polysaccharide transporter